MNIYIVNSNTNVEERNNVEEFNRHLESELEKYGIPVLKVCELNHSMILTKIESNDIIINYNGNVMDNYSNEKISKILQKAYECKCKIIPVAINRECRLPQKEIEKKQSFDVWEQLRCRSLDENYMPTVAKIFARKIISMVLPTLYCESGEIFLSHRRIDGEEITAKLYDKIAVMAKEATPFRDVINVKVGEDAQAVIDLEMEKSDVFVFLHTPKSGESDWVLKELRFALLRNIPILWVKIDDADEKKLRIKPSDSAHLSFNSVDFEDEQKLISIVDNILDKSFELIMNRSMQSLEYSEMLREIFGEKVSVYDEQEMIYHISMDRKGYHYPQRNIEQYYQIYGRNPNMKDACRLSDLLKDRELDSIAILTNKILSYSRKDEVSLDSIEDFYYHWSNYLGKFEGGNKNMEIVVSGAFPDADEIYKQSLTDALILFAKAIIRDGYELTFGSHPTFQELFFEIAKEECPADYKNKINMYISNWFLNDNEEEANRLRNNCSLYISEKKEDRTMSLTQMRKHMIQRKNVKALVCLGGKIRTNKTEEGIREEINLAKQKNIPVFVVGSVGGCSSKVAKEYKETGWSELNSASSELNDKFYDDIDYYNMAQEMLKFLDEMV